MLLNFNNLIGLILIMASSGIYADLDVPAIRIISKTAHAASATELTNRAKITNPFPKITTISNTEISAKNFNQQFFTTSTDFIDMQHRIAATAPETGSTQPVAVPLPTTAWAFLAGLLGILAISKRRSD